MRGITTLFLVLVLVAGCTPAPATSNTPKGGSAMPSSIVNPYVKIQVALANDSVDGVRASAGDIATAATALGSPAFRIDTAAASLAEAGELPDARQRFGTLSEAIITYMDGLHLTPPEGVKVAVCPTDQRRWLQDGSAIANPYSGPSAATCGAFR